MTIRWKLNLTVAALLAVFLVSVTIALRAVSENAERTRLYSRMRELSRFTSDVRTDLYQYLAKLRSPESPPSHAERTHWLQTVLDDIDVQIRLATGHAEKEGWSEVRAVVEPLRSDPQGVVGTGSVPDSIKKADDALWKLRGHYDLLETDLVAEVAGTSLNAQLAVGGACILTVLLFLVYLIMVRDWLVRPVEVLKRSAENIGRGDLDHRVPLEGHDELAQLARSLDAMATGLLRHQTELLEARALSAIGELCTNVAHGLRNPLASIRASAQLAERQCVGAGPGVERTRELLSELVRQADRLDERITKMFQYSRPCEIHRRRITFAELAVSAQRDLRGSMQAKSIRVSVIDLTEGRTWRLDAEQVAGALSELLSNAIHHSGFDAAIEIRGEVSPGSTPTEKLLRLSVADSGRGMARSTLEKAFDLFFTSRPDGTGMGLAMVRRMANKHGGEVSIASTLGEGTVVRITLPDQMHPDGCCEARSLQRFPMQIPSANPSPNKRPSSAGQ